MSSSPEPDDLKYDPSTHFRFGENWEAYSRLITDPKIDQAIDDMKRLLGATDLSGSSFVDVGCGSGLHSLVALRLGAAPVAGFDFDTQSVETARALLETRAKGNAWRIEQKNVFDVNPDTDGTFDWVYSWGVLHHTGALWDAIEKAMTLVADKGRFAIAIYRKTPCCRAWARFKRIYAGLPKPVQRLVRGLYIASFCVALAASRRNPFSYIGTYESNRGMDYFTDVHDWLGGYPYESASPAEIESFFEARGFVTERSFVKPTRLKGLFGTGCDEFVFRRI
ncbi:MAG: class I SAM-dependent methyltransferase [Rhodospirillales bacterium]|nr:class I SAM-dependent methyltransferase [Rhodospirillales bacterium]